MRKRAILLSLLLITVFLSSLSSCGKGNDVLNSDNSYNHDLVAETPTDDVSGANEPADDISSTDDPDNDALLTDDPGAEYPTYTITILATNDIHGHFDTLPEYLTIISQIRSERENVLLLDAGDFFKRGPYESCQGEIEISLFNAMGYDALVLGNNEFKSPGSPKSAKRSGTLEESDEQIANIIKWADFPVLCGNVTLRDSGAYIDGVKPYIVEHVGGIAIGIIGITHMDPAENNLDMAVNKDFLAGDEAVKQLLPLIREESDIQIVLSHAGFLIDYQIENVSAVISGHDHFPLENIKNAYNIPITQGGGEEKHCLSRLDLYFEYINGEWVLIDFDSVLYSADGVSKDMELQRMIDAFILDSENEAAA